VTALGTELIVDAAFGLIEMVSVAVEPSPPVEPVPDLSPQVQIAIDALQPKPR
jgi:hypothetical protein